jgi:hypothetical protein
MSTFDNLKGKASELVDKNSDKIAAGMDKAGELLDSKTGGAHTDKIATGKDKLKNALEGLDGKNDDFSDDPSPGGTPAPPPPPPAR